MEREVDISKRVRATRYRPSILIGATVLFFLAFMELEDLASRRIWGGDFLVTVWRPALAALHGANPYPPHDPTGSVYPPAIYLAAVPLTYVPWPIAVVVWQLLLVGAAILTLRLLGVTDWRCYGIWILSCPVIVDVGFGNATLLIVLLAACLWRYRDNVWATVLALTAAVTIKLLLAPMVAWLFLRGRRRAALLTVASSAVAILLPWTLIGFAGLSRYPARLEADGRLSGDRGALVQALIRQEGFGAGPAQLIGALLAIACFLAAWRFHDELSSFTFALLGTLLVSPIGWIYYLGVLVVPLAVRYPRFNKAWVVYAFLWVDWRFSPFLWYSATTSALVLFVCVLLLIEVVGERPEAVPWSVSEQGQRIARSK